MYGVFSYIMYTKTIDDMKTQKIDNDQNNIWVHCPHCEACEEQSIDEQRHHLQSYDIVKWIDVDNDKPEISIMKCHVCGNEFELIWNYQMS